MATLTVTPTQTFISGDTVLPATLNQLAQSTVALTAGTIVAADIASDAVTTVKILDANVTTAKILDANVTTAKLADSAVTTAKINNAAVTAAKLNGAQTGDAPIYGCRAWVNFDGTTDTTGAVSTANTNRLIRSSGNVTSVLRNGTGDYTVTFSTPMPDANYAATTGWTNTGVNTSFDGSASIFSAASVTASSVRVFSSQGVTAGVGEEAEYFAVAIFR